MNDQIENNVVEEVKNEMESTSDNESGVSLNECLEKGPPLQTYCGIY